MVVYSGPGATQRPGRCSNTQLMLPAVALELVALWHCGRCGIRVPGAAASTLSGPMAAAKIQKFGMQLDA